MANWIRGMANWIGLLGSQDIQEEVYVHDDMISKVGLCCMMKNYIKMKKNADPVELFDQSSAVKVQYERPGNVIDEN
jgi:hypothetical protein